MTISLYATRTNLLTSSTVAAGATFCCLLFPVDDITPPQKSRACSRDMIVPHPDTSRSRGRNTAWIYGRIEVNVKSHSSTNVGMKRSSGAFRRVLSKEEKPAAKRSLRSSSMLYGDRLWMQYCIC